MISSVLEKNDISICFSFPYGFEDPVVSRKGQGTFHRCFNRCREVGRGWDVTVQGRFGVTPSFDWITTRRRWNSSNTYSMRSAFLDFGKPILVSLQSTIGINLSLFHYLVHTGPFGRSFGALVKQNIRSSGHRGITGCLSDVSIVVAIPSTIFGISNSRRVVTTIGSHTSVFTDSHELERKRKSQQQGKTGCIQIPVELFRYLLCISAGRFHQISREHVFSSRVLRSGI
jgi:hypothetical protein